MYGDVTTHDVEEMPMPKSRNRVIEVQANHCGQSVHVNRVNPANALENEK
jgi:hypothetical protein